MFVLVGYYRRALPDFAASNCRLVIAVREGFSLESTAAAVLSLDNCVLPAA